MTVGIDYSEGETQILLVTDGSIMGVQGYATHQMTTVINVLPSLVEEPIIFVEEEEEPEMEEGEDEE